MRAAFDRDQQFIIAGKRNRVGDIVRVGAKSDQGRVLVDHAIPKLARDVIGAVTRHQQLPLQAVAKLFDRGLIDDCLLTG